MSAGFAHLHRHCHRLAIACRYHAERQPTCVLVPSFFCSLPRVSRCISVCSEWLAFLFIHFSFLVFKINAAPSIPFYSHLRLFKCTKMTNKKIKHSCLHTHAREEVDKKRRERERERMRSFDGLMLSVHTIQLFNFSLSCAHL